MRKSRRMADGFARQRAEHVDDRERADQCPMTVDHEETVDAPLRENIGSVHDRIALGDHDCR